MGKYLKLEGVKSNIIKKINELERQEEINDMVETKKILLKNGFDPNEKLSNGNSFLHLTAIPEIFRTLLDFGANPNVYNNDNHSVLDVHLKNKNNSKGAEILKMLKERTNLKS